MREPLRELLPWRCESWPGVAAGSWDELSRHGHQLHPQLEQPVDRVGKPYRRERERVQYKTQGKIQCLQCHRSGINLIFNTLDLQKFRQLHLLTNIFKLKVRVVCEAACISASFYVPREFCFLMYHRDSLLRILQITQTRSAWRFHWNSFYFIQIYQKNKINEIIK